MRHSDELSLTLLKQPNKRSNPALGFRLSHVTVSHCTQSHSHTLQTMENGNNNDGDQHSSRKILSEYVEKSA